MLQRRKTAEAIAAYRKVIELNPEGVEGYLALGNALMLGLPSESQLTEALGLYHQALQLEPTSALAYTGLGNVLRQQQKLEDAIAAYWQALRLDPHSDGAYQQLSSLLLLLHNTDAVIALYRHALQQRLATNAFFYTQMDRFLQQQNQLETLTSLYREGIEQYSAVPPQAGKEHFKQHFYGQLAQLFLEQKQPEKAIALY